MSPVKRSRGLDAVDGQGLKETVTQLAPPLICITGIDGCGKSTQASLLRRRLLYEGWDVASIWAGGRKPLTRPVVHAVQRYLRKPHQASDGHFYPRATPDGVAQVKEQFAGYVAGANALRTQHPLLVRVWTSLLLYEHALEIALAVRPQLNCGRAVVCDRYLYRSVINLAVMLDMPLSSLPSLLNHPALRLVPAPTLYFLIDVPSDIAYGRKHDLPGDDYGRQRAPLYREVAALAGMPVIDGTGSPEEIHARMWDVVVQTLVANGHHAPHRSGGRSNGR